MTCSLSWIRAAGTASPNWRATPSRFSSPQPPRPTCRPAWPGPATRSRTGCSPVPPDPPPGAEPEADEFDHADRALLAAQALAQAKKDAQERGYRPAAPTQDRDAQQKRTTLLPTAGQQARRRRRDDPAPLGAAIDGLVSETGWELAIATGSVFGRWAQIVGPDLAAHTAPDGLTDGVLTVTADSTAWATQVQLLAADLVRRLNAELGDGAVRRVKVVWRGAQGPRPGQWRARRRRPPAPDFR